MIYRNKKLTESAKHEECVSCGNPNCCWCHSNAYIHGKGRSQKAHDLFGFYGCMNCHDWFDGKSNLIPPSFEGFIDKEEWFSSMWQRSMIIACEKGYL